MNYESNNILLHHNNRLIHHLRISESSVQNIFLLYFVSFIIVNIYLVM